MLGEVLRVRGEEGEGRSDRLGYTKLRLNGTKKDRLHLR